VTNAIAIINKSNIKIIYKDVSIIAKGIVTCAMDVTLMNAQIAEKDGE